LRKDNGAFAKPSDAMRHVIILLLAVVLSNAHAQDAAASSPAPAASPVLGAPLPWLADRSAFAPLCSTQEMRDALGLSESAACTAAITASADFCDDALGKDFAKDIGSPVTDRKVAFYRGAAQGCFMGQMNTRTKGRFLQLVQASMARRGKQ
jgi:hypothetical protein